MQAPEEIESTSKANEKPPQSRGWVLATIIIAVAVFLCLLLWFGLAQRAPKEAVTPSEKTEADPNIIELPKEGPAVKLVTAGSSAPISLFTVTGTVEPNQQQLQQITPLVSGRVQNIFVALGDYVKPGTLLVRIDSPQVAESHGKLHEAETRVQLATINLNRVQQAANRVSILKAKASLDEAESNLKRTKLLVSEGLTAGKDLVAAQSNYDRAKADYVFQQSIPLNKEITEAQAELKTAKTEAEHLRDALKALDAHLPQESEGSEHAISIIELKSPIAGTVIERFVNPGAGFDQGKPLLTIANTSILWVIANVPEKQMPQIRVGAPATITLGTRTVIGKVSYIDPRLNEDTRTSRVRIEINNQDQRIQVGSFAQIAFAKAQNTQTGVFIPEAAIQTLNGNTVVFVHDRSGSFHVRKVDVGPATGGFVPVENGLTAGEQVAGDGSFILKSKALKEQFGDSD